MGQYHGKQHPWIVHYAGDKNPAKEMMIQII
jgi:hypothetical protein